MIRLLLALAVLGIVLITTMRMFSSQLGGAARITGADFGQGAASAGAAATTPAVAPRATVEQAAQAAQRALEQGAAAQALRASEAGR